MISLNDYVVGVDLGTSAVKCILVSTADGRVQSEASYEYPLYHDQTGWSEQDPEDWIKGTCQALKQLMEKTEKNIFIKGISFSGQMHGLILLNKRKKVLRRAILWNDTRTTPQCRELTLKYGQLILNITKNRVLEGFTLPKIVWIQQNEPDIFKQVAHFLLPKDYLRLRITGELNMEFSDAAGTLLLDIEHSTWSQELCNVLNIPFNMCPPLVRSLDQTGGILREIAAMTGLKPGTPVFAGGADNACGAIGAGILSTGQILCSIGTSGVVLSHEEKVPADINGGALHCFNHSVPGAYYTMGVTLSAGHSLQWFKKTFFPQMSYNDLLVDIDKISPGSQGLLFTPYLVGERTPYADSVIRGSFVNVDSAHTKFHFTRAILEGITFSLKESLELMKNQDHYREACDNTKKVLITSIGGGAKNPQWLQMQADIFGAPVVTLQNAQGPAMGAAMLAAVGAGLFGGSLKECAKVFVKKGDKVYLPRNEKFEIYRNIFKVYREVYGQTRPLCEKMRETAHL